VLIELEPFDLDEQMAEAKGKLAQAQAELDRVKTGARKEEIGGAEAKLGQLKANLDKARAGPRPQEIAEGKALLDQAVALRDLAKETYERTSKTFAARNASQEEMDQATNQLKNTEATVAVREQQLELLKEGTRKEDVAAAEAAVAEAQQSLDLLKNGSRPEDVAAAQAAVEAQKGAVAALNEQMKELKIVSPAEATVEAVDIRPGDLLPANAPALTVLDKSELWVRAYVPENHLGLENGQKVRVTVDSFPGKDFEGAISFVSRDAEFTPGNVQTPEERSKQVFRIRVTLKDAEGKLRAGMAADVWLGSRGK
jgi:multidrug resistance efflux pump